MLSGWSRERYLPYVFLEVKVSLCCVNTGTQPFCLRGEMPSPRCRALSAASACDDAQPFFRSRVSWEDSVPFRSAGRHSPLSRRRPFPLPGADTFLSAPPGKAGRSGGRGAEAGGRAPPLHTAQSGLSRPQPLLGTAFSCSVQSPPSFTFCLSRPPPFWFLILVYGSIRPFPAFSQRARLDPAKELSLLSPAVALCARSPSPSPRTYVFSLL